MKSLYTRIVVTFFLITVISGILALLVSNIYYLSKIRGYNEQKITHIAKEVQTLYAKIPDLDLEEYLTSIANLGFQIYIVNDRMESSVYGSPFKNQEMDPEQIRSVLEGKTYDGIREERSLLMVTRFFENSIRNSVGLPVQVNGKTYAMFVRPNLEQQIGEVRTLLAILIGYTFLFSMILIVIFTRYIVKPIQKLTAATRTIVGGDYNFQMDVSRRDEIGNLARHFTQMARSLSKLNEMRQEFVANVSHEIQSPLTSIQGFAQAIIDKETTREEEERYLLIIEEESRRLSSLSKQLLTLATLDKEDKDLEQTSFRLDEQIRQVLIVTEWQWTEKQLVIEPELPEVVIFADQQLLYQVWFNLITNSIKFSHLRGTIQIEIRVEHELVVSITDTGVGIHGDELPHIFDRFHKADKARNRSHSGSGLGLSIAQKIMDRHQGSIEVTSEFGKGTTFWVRLPYS